MAVRVNLHAHDRVGSRDSLTSAASMEAAYHARGYGLIGLVGHNARPGSDGDTPIARLDGVERGAGNGQAEPHVVEFDDVGFSFLAHPRRTWPTDTRRRALEFIERHDLDGVEKFSSGTRQYRGEMPVAELANDDAHATLGIGSSYMIVATDTATPEDVVDAIRRGRVELVNRRPSILGQAMKGTALLLGR